ncbi:unnamed protein product [Caenorhabditis auriculariae]|uniref:Uncharacterized protein n=1 Tax=Caenorhabditis auriculariae TaxID=2777116 RepID=A0A8S1GMP8_9PELO|nr:unnamed protein product [Caenorhabditis auriculariae]
MTINKTLNGSYEEMVTKKTTEALKMITIIESELERIKRFARGIESETAQLTVKKSLLVQGSQRQEKS